MRPRHGMLQEEARSHHAEAAKHCFLPALSFDEGVRKEYSRRNPPSGYEEMNQPDNHKSPDKPREGLDDPQVALKLANGASFVFRKSSPVLLRF
ncbi:unnamed protein product [Heligmosomoides polygyrus]|uniref:SH2 domain-containing protein n=1 Tax=Heligmosomoides polygyrus TaxID=6339 RepID=A0A183GBH9_HELPZ|nr:unnamed protein product [Heligmosomoides polygyrus]